MHLRLALATILNAKHGQFTLLAGIVCSSWTTINMATSGRTPCTPLGREDDREYVALANRMAARSFGHTFKEAFQLLYFMLNISCISKLLYIPMTNILSPGKSFRQVPWNHSYIYIYILYSCIVGPALLKLTPLRPRLALLIFVVEAMSGAWLVEQPSLSMLRFHPRIMDTFSFFEEP